MSDDGNTMGGGERLLLGIVLVATIAILWSAFRLPMYDASSHVATAVVAERLRHADAFTSAHYAIDPVPIPYWYTTLGLLAFFEAGADGALKILCTIHAILVPLAFYLLARTAAPSAVRFVPLVALTIFGTDYWSGETNFYFGQPWALLALAAALRARRIFSIAFAGFVACASIVYFAHVFVLSALLGHAPRARLRRPLFPLRAPDSRYPGVRHGRRSPRSPSRQRSSPWRRISFFPITAPERTVVSSSSIRIRNESAISSKSRSRRRRFSRRGPPHCLRSESVCCGWPPDGATARPGASPAGSRDSTFPSCSPRSRSEHSWCSARPASWRREGVRRKTFASVSASPRSRSFSWGFGSRFRFGEIERCSF